MNQRTAWTGERMDDLVAHLNARFDQIDARFVHLESRLDAGFDGIRSDLAANQRQFAAIGWTVAGALMAQLIAAVIGALIAFA